MISTRSLHLLPRVLPLVSRVCVPSSSSSSWFCVRPSSFPMRSHSSGCTCGCNQSTRRYFASAPPSFSPQLKSAIVYEDGGNNVKVASIEMRDLERFRNEFDYLVDVREPHEHAEANIAGSILMPLQQLKIAAQTMLKPYENKRLLVYCRGGVRSLAAAQIMNNLNCNAVNVKGGFLEYQKLKSQ